MFLDFQKITTATATRRSRILINSDEIMLMEIDQFYDKVDNVWYDATRVESGFLSFYTPSTFTDIASVASIVDVRNGAGSGSQSTNDPGVVDFAYPITNLPLLRCNMIFNGSRDTLNDYIFNPRYLVCAEEVRFNGTDTALQITLRDTSPKKILTDLSYDDLAVLLSAAAVPVP